MAPAVKLTYARVASRTMLKLKVGESVTVLTTPIVVYLVLSNPRQ